MISLLVFFFPIYVVIGRESFDTQNALITLFENWRSLDNKSFDSEILIDLLKAFDTLNHDLLSTTTTPRIWFST